MSRRRVGGRKRTAAQARKLARAHLAPAGARAPGRRARDPIGLGAPLFGRHLDVEKAAPHVEVGDLLRRDDARSCRAPCRARARDRSGRRRSGGARRSGSGIWARLDAHVEKGALAAHDELVLHAGAVVLRRRAGGRRARDRPRRGSLRRHRRRGRSRSSLWSAESSASRSRLAS